MTHVLRAAKTCVISMSSAVCNLTWELKSCLSFASLVSAGTYISRKKPKKKKRKACRALVSSRCQMHLTSYHKLGWVYFLQEEKTERSFGSSLGVSLKYVFEYEVVNGSLNSQVARILVRAIKRLPPLRDMFVSPDTRPGVLLYDCQTVNTTWPPLSAETSLSQIVQVWVCE